MTIKNSDSAVLSPNIVGESLIKEINDLQTNPVPINEYAKVFIVSVGKGKYICHVWPLPERNLTINTLTCYSTEEQARLGMIGAEFTGEIVPVTLGEAIQLTFEKPHLHGAATVFIARDLTVKLEKPYLKDQYKN